MRLSERLNELLNQQIVHELRNSNIYLQLASYCKQYQLDNLSNFFYDRSKEEKGHADKFTEYINKRTGGKVDVVGVEAPSLTIGSFEDLGRLYVETEELTTEKIEEIMSVVRHESSYMDEHFVLSMLDEQVAEEDEANTFALRISMVQDIVLFDATFKG